MSFDRPETPGNDGDGTLVSDHNSESSQRPWGPARRTLSVLAGLAGSAVVILVGGAVVWFALNGELLVLDPVVNETFSKALVIAVIVLGVVAPVAGGVASCVTSRPRWLVRGYESSLVALVLLVFLWVGLDLIRSWR